MVLLLLLLSQFPSASEIAWMEPSAFHLSLGQTRAEIERSFSKRGWKLLDGDAGSLIHDYADGKAITMEFRKDRLSSIRFELVSLRAGLSDHWDEVVAHLRDRYGSPELERPSLLVTGTQAMSVHAVLEDDPDSDLGRQGAGRIIVRYFDPAVTAGSFATTR